ncbi:Pentalenene oxygenase [Streptomyces sp. ADI96-02]|uniref:cytochrome P450 n=1 Tax=unclassified Streptomyces TaxID=2593676 RepID=UPI000F55685E|nr:cytochrome P450 [Streptomyces sp. ADI96-02]RPK56907.1 Pentalenene oxygenase [Streptomyces sp. ADI96-02]
MKRASGPDRPPGPRGHWLFGNSEDYDRDRSGFLERCHREFGDVFSFDARTVVVSSPDQVHALLTRTNEDFLAENSPLAGPVDTERMADDAKLWTTTRRAGWQGLHRRVAQAHAERLHEIFLDTVGDGELDVLATMTDFFGRATADFCLGPDAAGVPEALAENVAAIDPLSRNSLQFPAWWPSRKVRRFTASRERLLALMTDLVRRRRSAGESPVQDLLGVLLAPRDQELSDLQIERFLRGIMLAALGVPATALAWIVYELGERPDVLARLEAEAATADGTVPEMGALPYTEAFVKEVLRLWPPTWLIGRTVRRDTELDGWRLRTGDQVMFSMYRLHRDPRWWSEPDRLVPERWLDPHSTPVRHTYLPFGAGPRVCVGTQLGMMQLTLATFWLVGGMEITRSEGAAVTPDFGGLLLPRNLSVRLRRKSSLRI